MSGLDAWVERRMVRHYRRFLAVPTTRDGEVAALADMYREGRNVEPDPNHRFRSWRRQWQIVLLIAGAVTVGLVWQIVLTPNPVKPEHLWFGGTLVVVALIVNVASVLIDRRMDAHGWRLAADNHFNDLDRRIAAQVFTYPEETA